MPPVHHDINKELHDQIQKQISFLKSEKQQVPKYQERITEIEQSIPKLTKRFQTRQRLSLIEEKQQLENKIKDLDSDGSVNQLQQEVAPYVQAMRQHEYHKGQSDGVTKSTLILNDYLSNVQNEGVMVHMEDNETCTKCEVPLVRVSDQSILACPVCGSQSNYLDCSINSLSFQDDHEVQGKLKLILLHFHPRTPVLIHLFHQLQCYHTIHTLAGCTP